VKHRNRSHQRCAVADRRGMPSVENLSDLKLIDAVLMWKNHPYEWAWKQKGEDAHAELCRRFRVRNEIGPTRFKETHWQTLFKIEFPGVL
jgi:hypothetical protein